MKLQKFGNYAKRRVYSSKPAFHDIQNLYKIQIESFQNFRDNGIREVFEELGPIKANKHISLHYQSHRLDYDYLEKEGLTPLRAIERKESYEVPVYATFLIIDDNTGESVEKEFYICSLPLMTENGTVIFNGAERVIVSQLSLAPGFYLPKTTFKSIKRNSVSSSNLPQIRKEDGMAIMFEITDNVTEKLKEKSIDTIYSIMFSLSKNRDLAKIRGKIDMTLMLAVLGVPLDLIESEVLRLDKNKNIIEYGIHKNQYDYYMFLKEKILNHNAAPINQNASLQRLKKINATVSKMVENTKINDAKKLDKLLSNEKVEKENKIAIIEEQFTLLKSIANVIKSSQNLFEIKDFGRTRLNNKLSIENRLHNKILAEDIYDKDKNLLFKKGTHLRSKVLRELMSYVEKGICRRNISINKDLISLLLETDNSPRINQLKLKLVWNLIDQYQYKKDEEKELVKQINQKLDLLLRKANSKLSEEYKTEINEFIKRLAPTKKLSIDLIHIYKDFNDYNHALEDPTKDYSVPIIGVPQNSKNISTKLQLNDLLSILNFIYITSIYDEFSSEELFDEMDEISNKQVKPIGVLLKKELKTAINKRIISNYKLNPEDSNAPDFKLSELAFNAKAINASIKTFFGSDQLSQFMDQVNPLSELTHKRRLSGLGKGGISKDDNRNSIRDVTGSHYGRICPIETPEGWNIGVINSLALYAKIDQFGMLEAPYNRVINGQIQKTKKPIFLSTNEEAKSRVAEATVKTNENDEIINDIVPVRYYGDPNLANKNDISYVDFSPQQAYSVSTACIPFLERDDANRALMGANMQRQAVPLIKPDSPFVGTGVEYLAGKYSGAALIAQISGTVTYVDANKITITSEDGKTKHIHQLKKFIKTNQSTCQNQRPLVAVNDKVKKGDLLADGYSMQDGELALGQNPLVAFMTWEGYNFEDAVIISERLVKEDVYTSIHMEVYEIQSRRTDLGYEEITREVPNVSEMQIMNLDDRGIIKVGTEVKPGDILVGKVTPKGVSELSSEEQLLYAIFGEKSKDVKDNSLRMPNSGTGKVQKVVVLNRASGDKLPNDVEEIVRVYIAEKRKIKRGDKMAGRHGNKGVISVVVPEEDMPYMEDGTPIDIILNPLGVPSRMNIGQVLELHLGMAARNLSTKIASPIFDGITETQLSEIMQEANIPNTGKYKLYNGKTGEMFDNPISVGVMYMMKLNHMVDDKMHARSTGPYSIITRQPLGGKAQFGGQRLGEMEVWALEAYGAANILQEMLTVKSDDVEGRNKMLGNIETGLDYTDLGVPETFNVLVKNLEALCIDVEIEYDESNIVASTNENQESYEEN